MTTSPSTSADNSHTIGARWKDIPLHTIQRTAEILGCAPSSVYGLLKADKLSAVRLCGKTLVSTESIEALIRTAKPWTPNHARVKAATRARLKRMTEKHVPRKLGAAL
jgi:hypothetical protein